MSSADNEWVTVFVDIDASIVVMVLTYLVEWVNNLLGEMCGAVG